MIKQKCKKIIPLGLFLAISLLVLPRISQAATVYVDGDLTSDCLSENYSIISRNCSGGDGVAYKTMQGAADVVSAGSTIYLRGGDYYDDETNRSGPYSHILKINVNGTSQNKIKIKNYNNELVRLIGKGYEDRDLNADGLADGVDSADPEREVLLIIEGDFIEVSGLEIMNSSGAGVSLRASFCVLENLSVHDNWGAGIMIGFDTSETKIVEENYIRLSETYNNRHSTGIFLGRSGPGSFDTYLNYVRNNVIEENLSYNNGYLPSGDKVLPIVGDPAGGGNSDAISTAKIVNDSATESVENWAPGNLIKNNIGFGNADDGFDFSFADSIIEGNISFKNGPEAGQGFKVLRVVKNLKFYNNIAWDNDQNGFEFRADPSAPFEVYNNIAINNANRGFTGGNCKHKNNLARINRGLYDYVYAPAPIFENNWDGKYAGDPEIINENFSIDTNFPNNLTISEKFLFVKSQFENALAPKEGSPLIDTGIYIEGYHNPQPGEGLLKDWYGLAPDIGVFEYQITIRGDVDNNSITNTTDALLTLRNSLGLDMNATIWQASSTTGDVDCNGASNSTDALLILRYSLGLSMETTAWCE